MSRVTMLTPAVGIQGVKDFVVKRVKESGANPCPPTIVGVGIGGTFETTALLAKKALLRPIGSQNPDPELAALEQKLYEEINALGIGPQGLGRQNHLSRSTCKYDGVSHRQSAGCSQHPVPRRTAQGDGSYSPAGNSAFN